MGDNGGKPGRVRPETRGLRRILTARTSDTNTYKRGDRGQGTTLANPTRKGKEGGQITVYVDRTLDAVIEQIHPRNKRRAETRGGEGGPHEVPIDSVKRLLLIKGQNRHKDTGRGGIVYHIT